VLASYLEDYSLRVFTRNIGNLYMYHLKATDVEYSIGRKISYVVFFPASTEILLTSVCPIRIVLIGVCSIRSTYKKPQSGC